MGLFKWWSKKSQERIENYLGLLSKETPEVAREVLNLPIKSVHRWMTNDYGTGTTVVTQAKCGCLIGVTLMAINKVNPDADPRGVLIEDRVIRGLRTIDGEFGRLDQDDIQAVGMDVYREVYNAVFDPSYYDTHEEYRDALDERERALVFKMKNIIRENLGIPQLTKPE